MGVITTVFDYIINTLGSTLFMALIMLILGLIAKMKPAKAFSSAITFAVALSGISLVIGYMSGAITPVAEAMTETVGKTFNILDGGWATLASITWSWKYAFLLFPFQILINLVMFLIGKTKTINIDLWNVWGKAFQCILIITLGQGKTLWVVFALVVAAVRIICELIVGDAMEPLVLEKSGIPGITSPHSAFLFSTVLYPVELLLRKIPFIENSSFDVAWLKSKIGVFAENHVIGFILGVIFGLVGRYSVVASLTLGVTCATALTLLPVVTKYFMQALAPISEACSAWLKKKTKNHGEIFVGLDAAVLLGNPEIWVACMITIPLYLVWAVVLPNNAMLPFAGIVNLALAVSAFYVARGNILKMVILMGLIGAPVFLSVGTAVAPLISDLAVQNGFIEAGSLISNAALDAPVYVYAFTWLFDFLNGNFLPLIVAVYWIFGYVIMIRDLRKYNRAKRGTAANN